jgi:hypothetical protein
MSPMLAIMLALTFSAGPAASAAPATVKAPFASAASVAAPAAAKAPTGSVEVTLDQSQVTTTVGARLTVNSRIVNPGSVSTDSLVAHLNVASLDGVYVDLEDWSADVTRPLAPLAPGASTSLSWEFQAVNTGNFGVYVVVLPSRTDPAGTAPPVASSPVHVTVAGKPTLTAGGALPVVVLIPVLLGLAACAAWLRRRRGVRPGR